MSTPEAIAADFRSLNFHDDTLVAIRILPDQVRAEARTSAIEIELLQYCANTRRLVRFLGCRNVRIAMDFDILSGNLPPNTSGVDAHINESRLRDLMLAQKKNWGVDYLRTPSPLDSKLKQLSNLVGFHLQFFGGAVEIVAQNFEMKATGDQDVPA